MIYYDTMTGDRLTVRDVLHRANALGELTAEILTAALAAPMPTFDTATEVAEWDGEAMVVRAKGPADLAADLAARKADMRDAVQSISDTLSVAGYEHDFGSAGVHVLQTRERDRPNWLALASIAQIAIGQGEVTEPIATVRTLANVNISVTAPAALAAMVGMQTHLGAVIRRGWELKDAITAAEDDADLDAIDVDADWPATPEQN